MKPHAVWRGVVRKIVCHGWDGMGEYGTVWDRDRVECLSRPPRHRPVRYVSAEVNQKDVRLEDTRVDTLNHPMRGTIVPIDVLAQQARRSAAACSLRSRHSLGLRLKTTGGEGLFKGRARVGHGLCKTMLVGVDQR